MFSLSPKLLHCCLIIQIVIFLGINSMGNCQMSFQRTDILKSHCTHQTRKRTKTFVNFLVLLQLARRSTFIRTQITQKITNAVMNFQMFIQRSFATKTITTMIAKVLFLLQVTLEMVIEGALCDKSSIAIIAFVNTDIFVIFFVQCKLICCRESGSD